MADEGDYEQSGAAGGEDEITGEEPSSLRCRMYQSKYPEVDELVTVQVKRIEEMGAYVSLLEYDNIEGMILLSELSRRRIRSINKLIRVGKQEIVMVLRVDPEKGYIDLSKRRVAPDDLAHHEDKFNKSKTVHSVLRHVADSCGKNLEELYTQFGWPLYKKYGHAYDGFKIAVFDAESVFGEFKLDADILETLLKTIRRKLTPQPVKVRADFELTCFHYDGVDAIKAALQCGIQKGNDDTPIKIKLVAPPLYVMTTMSVGQDAGLLVLKQALDAIEEKISHSNGILNVKIAPRAVGKREDEQLNSLMDKLKNQAEEVSGDDEEEEDEGMGVAD